MSKKSLLQYVVILNPGEERKKRYIQEENSVAFPQNHRHQINFDVTNIHNSIKYFGIFRFLHFEKKYLNYYKKIVLISHFIQINSSGDKNTVNHLRTEQQNDVFMMSIISMRI